MKTFAIFYILSIRVAVRQKSILKKDWTHSIHVMGPMRNGFHFEAGQVKIKSIAELKTFHIFLCACSMMLVFFPSSFRFFSISIIYTLFFIVCRRSIAKRTLELVFSLFSARTTFWWIFGEQRLGKMGSIATSASHSIDLQYLCFRFKHLLFLWKSLFIAHLAMALAQAGKRKENEEKKTYIL